MNQRLDMLDKMIAKGSVDPFVSYARALELRSLGRKDEALSAFGEVRERFPGYVPTYLMAGQLAAELGLFDVARDFLTQGLSASSAAGDEHAASELNAALASLPQ